MRLTKGTFECLMKLNWSIFYYNSTYKTLQLALVLINDSENLELEKLLDSLKSKQRSPAMISPTFLNDTIPDEKSSNRKQIHLLSMGHPQHIN